jgi:hypothetical protein
MMPILHLSRYQKALSDGIQWNFEFENRISCSIERSVVTQDGAYGYARHLGRAGIATGYGL